MVGGTESAGYHFSFIIITLSHKVGGSETKTGGCPHIVYFNRFLNMWKDMQECYKCKYQMAMLILITSLKRCLLNIKLEMWADKCKRLDCMMKYNSSRALEQKVDEKQKKPLQATSSRTVGTPESTWMHSIERRVD